MKLYLIQYYIKNGKGTVDTKYVVAIDTPTAVKKLEIEVGPQWLGEIKQIQLASTSVIL